ncbi:LysR family transcriptional regulator [Salmonella enterica subsp. enterica serovar Javiana]|nr:LysR family transcriptional regulator [Salmonella enterica subsp. enterica serovar Javiana]
MPRMLLVHAGAESHARLRLILELLATGSSLTETGEEVLQVALELKATVSTLERRLAGKQHRLEGRIRLTTCDTLMDSVIPTLLERFTAVNPEITFDITTGNYVSVSAQRDSDVAIRTRTCSGEIHSTITRGSLSCSSIMSRWRICFISRVRAAIRR